MTREEAIDDIKNNIKPIVGGKSLDMAIQALSEQPCGDTISRQAAIDALADYIHNVDKVYSTGKLSAEDCRDAARSVIGELPSAQPERTKDIIQKFHDYQVEWLTSHCDLELEPVLESCVVRFLHDTANCYMMEVKHETD